MALAKTRQQITPVAHVVTAGRRAPVPCPYHLHAVASPHLPPRLDSRIRRHPPREQEQRGAGRRSCREMEGSGERAAVVRRLMAAKAESGKSFSDVAAETGLTNVYVAQLLRRQAQLKPATAPALRAALPALTDDLVDLMMQPPFRSYHPDIVHEPAIYRLNEAVMHFGESIKEIINEEFGDGIASIRTWDALNPRGDSFVSDKSQ
ncbi:hypothetical protein ACP4OV_010656 [Aristida adscensionis]